MAGLWRLQKNHPHLYQQGVWLFGGLDEDYLVIGLNPGEIRLTSPREDERLHRDIWNLRKQKLPLYPNYVMKNYSRVFKHAIARHGSWTKGLMAHGITPPPKRYRLHLLIQLRDTQKSGAKLTRQFRWELDYYFGSVGNAKLELKTDTRILNGWGTSRVILEIQRRHRLKLSLVYAVVLVELPVLIGAAETYFGGWGRALHAAGVDPNLYFVHHT